MTNNVGSDSSNPATLIVNDPPEIATHPQSQTLNPGETATFNIVATGAGPLTYQWSRGGVDIDGANASSYSITSVQESDEGDYACHVANNAGSDTSDPAALTVNDSPVIVGNIPDQIEDENAPSWTLDLTVYESDTEDNGIDLRWSVSGADTSLFIASITDSDNDILTFTPVQYANGSDSITLTLTDSGDLTATQNINITLSNVVMKGDINDDQVIDIQDAILAIQVYAGLIPESEVYILADVNGDGKIGIEEAIYILQEVSELR
ncbi:immunoglobulin domain-containing protein [Thermodesulfobacteriota bacterium]